MSSSKVLNLIPGHTFCARGLWLPGCHGYCVRSSILPLKTHTCKQGCLAVLGLNSPGLGGRLFLNWLRSSMGNNTAGHRGTAGASYDAFTLLDDFFLETWFMDFISCSQEDWQAPDTVHLVATSKSVEQWFSRLMACLWEYYVARHTGAEN